MLESLTFLFPWLLGALAALPLLWWLLRVIPPQPRRVKFSAFYFLRGLTTSLTSTAHTPWWVLLLRCLTAAAFIVAFAEPVLHPAEKLPGGNGAVMLVVDNGWAAASHWSARVERMRETLQRAGRDGRPLLFLPTAPAEDDGHVRVYGPLDAARADEFLSRLRPESWPAAPEDAAAALEKSAAAQKITYAAYFSDGTTEDAAGSKHLLRQVNAVVMDEDVNTPLILRHDDTGYSLERLRASPRDTSLSLVAYTRENAVADEIKLVFPAGRREMSFNWDMLPEVRNRTARLALSEPSMASAIYLANAEWRQHPVGLVADAEQRESRNFLSEVYYLRRALEDKGQLTMDSLSTLIGKSISTLVLPDSTPLSAEERGQLAQWVEKGGFLIRFAGPNLAAAEDDMLLPVHLRAGQRAMEGAMTWEKPLRIAEIADQSPLFGLSVPQDVTVTRQVLADPTPEVFEKTWLQLEDGTPLITGGKMGRGTVVLIHTSAGPDWSNFCYSGLFVEALQRMTALSNGISDYKPKTTLPPLLLLDGFGGLSPPGDRTVVTSIAANADFTPSPQTPPGLYGGADDFRAFNLGDNLAPMRALDVPAGLTVESYQKAGEADLKPLLLKCALLLLLIDTLVTLRLRGILSVFFALLLWSVPAAAAEDPKDLVSGLYLAYIETGDQDVDRTSYNGLTGLGETVSARTTARVRGVAALNPDSDDLSFYPLIYWPMSEHQRGLSLTAVHNVQNYLAQGGIILFDTRDMQFGAAAENGSALGARKLRELTQSLQIPALVTAPRDHILTRSFYLLDEFPGHYAGGKLWVEKEPSARHDSVSSVIIGGNDWAAVWSKDENDERRFMPEPGGARQREMAYRFGVNLVMVALTGNYKSDQVQMTNLLERIGE